MLWFYINKHSIAYLKQIESELLLAETYGVQRERYNHIAIHQSVSSVQKQRTLYNRYTRVHTFMTTHG